MFTKSLSNRLDVIYYLIRDEVKKGLKKSKGLPLHKLCQRIRTKTPPREAYVERGVPCLKLRNVTGRFLNITNYDFIPERIKNRYTTAKKYDILITATGEGTAGRADIFLELEAHVVTGEIILLRPRIDLINPFYLLAVLRTEIVSKQLTHFVRGATGQTHLYWQDIANIQVPETDKEIQEKCEHLYQKAWIKRRSAAEKVRRVKENVIKAVEVEHIDVHQRNLVFETRFGQIQDTLRFDVEYYQPIHETLRAALKKAGCVEAASMLKLNKTTVNPRKIPTAKFQYVDISSINTETGDYEFDTLYGHEAPTRARKKPKKGDLIVSTVRPNRNAVAVIEKKPDNLVVSTGFAVVTPTAIKPSVLFAILKTEPIYAQIVRRSTAAMYPAVTEEDVTHILVPQLSKSQADQVEQYICEATNLRQQSDCLLEEFRQQGEHTLT